MWWLSRFLSLFIVHHPLVYLGLDIRVLAESDYMNDKRDIRLPLASGDHSPVNVAEARLMRRNVSSPCRYSSSNSSFFYSVT